jgi:hypothetical protein
VKKVRYAIGAAGIAPALGLMLPIANAAPAAAHTPRKAPKTVSLQHIGTATKCTGTFSRSIHASTPGFYASLAVAGNCMLSVTGHMHLSTSPWPLHIMTTRVYNHGVKVFSGHTNSLYDSGNISFAQHLGVRGHRACETVALAKSPHKVLFGPVCETI